MEQKSYKENPQKISKPLASKIFKQKTKGTLMEVNGATILKYKRTFFFCLA